MAEPRGWLYYGVPGLQMVPYMIGTPVWKDDLLPYLYYKTRDQNKLADLFCGETKNLPEFVNYFHSNKLVQCLCKIRENLSIEPVGWSWVDGAKGSDGYRVAMCGMCFFDGAERISRSLAKLSLAYAFEEMRISTFLGIQVESNWAARNFSMRVGFKQVALVPNYHVIGQTLQPARVMMLNAADFLPKFHEWHEQQKRPTL